MTVLDRRAALALTAAALAAPGVLAEAADAELRRPVDALCAALIDVMRRAAELGFDGRRSRLAPVVDATFAFPVMARAIIGPAWAQTPADERERFTVAFRAFTVATFAQRFAGWSGERFEVADEVRLVGGGGIVASRLLRGDGGEPVQLDYLVRKDASGPRIVDIYLQGTISEVATKRAEFGALLRRDGMAKLIETIEARTPRG